MFDEEIKNVVCVFLYLLYGPVWRELAELWQEAPQQCGSAT